VPGYVAVGELGNLWGQGLVNDRLCGCGESFSSCPFWSAVGREAFGGWDKVDGREALALRLALQRTRTVPFLLGPELWPSFAEKWERYGQLVLQLYQGIIAVTEAQVVVDSSKQPARAFMLRSMPEVSLRVLHLVRSSQGVCYSWAKHVSRGDVPVGEEMGRNSTVRAAARWNTYNGLIELLRLLNVPTLGVRYEDFVTGPRTEMRRITGFLGSSVSDEDLAFIGDSSVDLVRDHSVWGNPMRTQVGHVTLRMDDEWRIRLPTRTRRLVTALTAPGLLRYGYIGSARAPHFSAGVNARPASV
jgi:hypothetical protein